MTTVYSSSVKGIIDTKPPELFGSLEPSDDSYELGDVISATFNEPLSCSSFNSSNFSFKRLSDNSDIDATLGCYQNGIVISPSSSLAPLVGEQTQG